MPRPNLILITIDRMRRDAFGAAGNPDVRTPNLDALAAHGMFFTQAALCRGRNEPGDPVDTAGALPFPLHTLASRIGATGYQCAAMGAVQGGASAWDDWLSADPDNAEGPYARWRRSEAEARPDAPEEALHLTTWTGNQAVRYCQTAREPFFLWAGFCLPPRPPAPWHAMYAARALTLPDEARGDGEGGARKTLAAHYGAISHIDRHIGRILATLTARARTNNVLLFTALQGACLGNHEHFAAAAPLCEGDVRVPCIVGGLLGQRKGERDPALICHGDMAATLLDILDLDTTCVPGGESVLPQLRSAGAPHRRSQILYDDGALRAVRTTRHKWITDGQSKREYLFDLQADPAERDNIGETRQALAIRKMLRGMIGDTRE